MGDNHANNGQRRRGEQCTNTDCQQLRIRFNGMAAHAAVATTRPSPTSSTRRCRRDRRDTHRTTFSFLCKHAYTQRQTHTRRGGCCCCYHPLFSPMHAHAAIGAIGATSAHRRWRRRRRRRRRRLGRREARDELGGVCRCRGRRRGALEFWHKTPAYGTLPDFCPNI